MTTATVTFRNVLILLTLTFFFTNCQNEEAATESTETEIVDKYALDDQGTKMHARIDGEEWGATTVNAYQSGARLLLTGSTEDGKEISITINGELAVKSYTISTQAQNLGSIQNSALYLAGENLEDRFKAPVDGDNGLVQITSIEGDVITGTFKFRCASISSQRLISEGRFKVAVTKSR